MCKLGDIIVVDQYVGDDGKKVGRHSFIVVEDDKGYISGLDYDLVMAVISSFKSEEHRRKKLSYKENIEIEDYENNGQIKKFIKPSYIKADKLYYFNKQQLNYYIFGRISDDLFNNLIKLIIDLAADKKIKNITANLLENK